MLKILVEKTFKKDVKKYKNNDKIKKLVEEVIEKLAKEEILDRNYNNHPLKGECKSAFDCHTMPDIVSIQLKSKYSIKNIAAYSTCPTNNDKKSEETINL